MRLGRKKWLIVAAITAVVLCMVGGFAAFAFEWYRYRNSVAYQMPALAGAIRSYTERYGSLPEKITTIEATGLYGRGAYRLPKNGWEGWNEHTGPYVHYLPVREWNKGDRYIIAVQPKVPGVTGRARCYVVLGETAVYQVGEQELERLLAADDEARGKAGQPGRWADVLWQE